MSDAETRYVISIQERGEECDYVNKRYMVICYKIGGDYFNMEGRYDRIEEVAECICGFVSTMADGNYKDRAAGHEPLTMENTSFENNGINVSLQDIYNEVISLRAGE